MLMILKKLLINMVLPFKSLSIKIFNIVFSFNVSSKWKILIQLKVEEYYFMSSTIAYLSIAVANARKPYFYLKSVIIQSS